MINLGGGINRVRYRHQPVLQLQALRHGKRQQPDAQFAHPPTALLTNALLQCAILVRYAHTYQARRSPRPLLRISVASARLPRYLLHHQFHGL